MASDADSRKRKSSAALDDHDERASSIPCRFFNQSGACRHGDARGCAGGVHGSEERVASTELELAPYAHVPASTQAPLSLVAQFSQTRRAVAHFLLARQTAADPRVAHPRIMDCAFFAHRMRLLPAQLAPASFAKVPTLAIPPRVSADAPIRLRERAERVSLNPPSLVPVINALRSASLFPPPQSTSNPAAVSFITFRNNLNKLVNDAEWRILVERVGRTLFLRQTQFPLCNFGLVGRQFEEQCTIAPAAADLPPMEFCTVVHAVLGTHRLYIGAEIDAVDDRGAYVEIKTTKSHKADASSTFSLSSTSSSSSSSSFSSPSSFSSSSSSLSSSSSSTTASASVLSDGEQHRIWTQCFFSGCERLIVGVDACATRGEAEITSVLDLHTHALDSAVTHAWKEQRLKHVRRVLDWVQQCVAQGVLEERTTYWLQQTAVAQKSDTFALSLNRVDTAHAFLTNDVRRMFSV